MPLLTNNKYDVPLNQIQTMKDKHGKIVILSDKKKPVKGHSLKKKKIKLGRMRAVKSKIDGFYSVLNSQLSSIIDSDFEKLETV